MVDPLYSIYIHIPFCQKRCHYCDFVTYAGMEAFLPAYVDALCKEIVQVGGDGLPVHTIYFGGGTPSVLSLNQFQKILTTIQNVFQVLPGAEISAEANPGTVTLESLDGMRRIGINRLSIGMQSANPEELVFLGRIHDVYAIQKSVSQARSAGFDHLSLDLIFGLPGQTIRQWQNTVEYTISLQPEHVSFYGLTIEDETPLGKWLKRGLVEAPDPDAGADMYEWAAEQLEKAGFRSYEISNWALLDPIRGWMQCRHNMQYWRLQPYFGLGAGAHGYLDEIRTVNASQIGVYIQKMQAMGPQTTPGSSATVELNAISSWEQAEEMMMMGLRMTHEGVDEGEFITRFGISLEEAFPHQIQRLIQEGLLEWVPMDGRHLRLTRRGWLLGNQVFMEFVGCPPPALFHNHQGSIPVG